MIISIQGDFAVSFLLEIRGPAEPGGGFNAINAHPGMEKLIGEMRNIQQCQEPVGNDLVDAFMPDDPAVGIII